MKMLFFTMVLCCTIIAGFSQTGNIGIGTSDPKARLHVADSSVVFTAAAVIPITPNNPPVSGAGTRMMWYADKAAFRAGNVDGNQWDMNNVGTGSSAMGLNNIASGYSAVALGSLTTATGDNSVGLGYFVNASGNRSTAAGYVATSSGFASTALGFGPIASGNYSVSIGSNTQAAGGNSLSMGEYSIARGNNAATIGLYTVARSNYSFVTGKYNDTTATNSLFEIGNGTATNARKNAMTVLQNGNVGILISSPKALLHVADSNVLFTGPLTVPNTTNYAPPASGAGSRMMWYPQKAAFRVGFVSGVQWDKDNIGLYSHASGFGTTASGTASTSMGEFTSASGTAATSMGDDTNASGTAAVSMGDRTIASGYASTSMGDLTIASGFAAVSMGDRTNAIGFATTSMGEGTKASGYVSTSLGYRTNAIGFATTTMGEETKARSDNSLVIGSYNDTSSTNRLFEIGNGTANNARSNALTVLRNGNIGIVNTNPIRPLSFPASLGEKILLFPGAVGEVGIGVYGNELRIHSDNPGAKVSFGTQTNAGVFTENAKAERNGAFAFSIFGSLWVNGTTYASDERFKQNITPISSPLQKLLLINGVEYEMKTKEFSKNYFSAGRQIGLLAQNVEKIVPEAVNETDGYKGVDYARLVPLLIESIKELKLENDQQKKRIEALEQSLLKQ